jgi:Fur family ferric uptake transcriptional regulator
LYWFLNSFSDIRPVVSSEIGGKAAYEIADPNPHHHLVCRLCGQVESLADHHFQELGKHRSDEHGFKAEMDHLTISGVCAHCSYVADQ